MIVAAIIVAEKYQVLVNMGLVNSPSPRCCMHNVSRDPYDNPARQLFYLYFAEEDAKILPS